MTVLVANRGEIARRIFRTARRLGMKTVAVYSDADADEPFVREADQAIRLGPAEARESYLSVERIMAAVKDSGATLVHPGYGFLAEDPRLAGALEDAEVTFVGPSPNVVRLFGDKAVAKDLARHAQVPVLAGYDGEDQADAEFILAAEGMGYPLMVKPVAGGGGIGMHLVTKAGDLPEALEKARRVAGAAFGDKRLLLERALKSLRHVEIQILADEHGAVVAFDERDCSTQRRHQKVMEESPSPAVDDALREKLKNSAIAIARATGYVGAGTVEFALADDGRFYFLEVNARLQVEHPVTEELYGIDLVEQQLRIALGEALTVADAKPTGHAIEVRLYAEDPAAGFLPSTGELLHVGWPKDVRVDAGPEEGSLVTAHYDPMLAKIIAKGPDRAKAIATLSEALGQLVVLGVHTNLAFLKALLAHPALVAGAIHTNLIEQELGALVPTNTDPPPEALALAATALVSETYKARESSNPWSALGPWRLGAAHVATVLVGERTVRVEGSGPFKVGELEISQGTGKNEWLVNGEVAWVALSDTAVWVHWKGEAHEIESKPRERRIEELVGTEVLAPMPGVVLSVAARDAANVKRGETLFVIEAMKMELRVEAPANGVVKRVLCQPGQRVERGERLAEFEVAAE